MKKWIITAIAASALLTFQACTNAHGSLEQMRELSEYLDKHADSMSMEEWEISKKKYEDICSRETDREYTAEELEEMGKLHGKLSVIFLKKAATNAGSYLKGFFGAAGEQIDGMFDSDDTKEFLQDLEEGIDGFADSVDSALEGIEYSSCK